MRKLNNKEIFQVSGGAFNDIAASGNKDFLAGFASRVGSNTHITKGTQNSFYLGTDISAGIPAWKFVVLDVENHEEPAFEVSYPSDPDAEYDLNGTSVDGNSITLSATEILHLFGSEVYNEEIAPLSNAPIYKGGEILPGATATFGADESFSKANANSSGEALLTQIETGFSFENTYKFADSIRNVLKYLYLSEAPKTQDASIDNDSLLGGHLDLTRTLFAEDDSVFHQAALGEGDENPSGELTLLELVEINQQINLGAQSLSSWELKLHKSLNDFENMLVDGDLSHLQDITLNDFESTFINPDPPTESELTSLTNTINNTLGEQDLTETLMNPDGFFIRAFVALDGEYVGSVDSTDYFGTVSINSDFTGQDFMMADLLNIVDYFKENKDLINALYNSEYIDTSESWESDIALLTALSELDRRDYAGLNTLGINAFESKYL